MYHYYSNELDAILEEAAERGEDQFYDSLIERLENLSNAWTGKNEGGDLTREEMTKLIQRKHFVLGRINEIRRSGS